MEFYSKVIKEAPEGALIIGLNHFQIQTYGDAQLIEDFQKLKQYKIDDVFVFIK